MGLVEDQLADLSTPIGIAIVVVGIFLAVKVAKTALKFVFLAAVAGGLYLWFGVNGGATP